MIQKDYKAKFIDEAIRRWGKKRADEYKSVLDDAADAADTIDAYKLNPEDEPTVELNSKRGK